jgi:carbon storage regulator
MALPSRDPGDGTLHLLAHPSVDRETSTSIRLPAIDCKAKERLRRSSYLALRDISCIASDGVDYLHGCLPSDYLKQVAQKVAAGVEGVRHLINQIEVLGPVARTQVHRRSPPTKRSESGHRYITRGDGGPPRVHDRRKEIAAMLVLSRKLNETIIINGDIRIMVVSIQGNRVRLSIEAPNSVRILRQELCDRAVAGEVRDPGCACD